jgi:hypothetical protein
MAMIARTMSAVMGGLLLSLCRKCSFIGTRTLFLRTYPHFDRFTSTLIYQNVGFSAAIISTPSTSRLFHVSQYRTQQHAKKVRDCRQLAEHGRGEGTPLTARDARGRCGEHRGGQP